VTLEFEPGPILINGRIHTFKAQAIWAEALVLQNGRICYVGSNDEAKSMARPYSQVVDLGGRHVLPGLIDAHIHLETFSLALGKVDCSTPDKETCLTRVASRVERLSPQDWLLGHGWNQNLWGGFGDRRDLDRVSPYNPVYLTALSLHAAWVNSRALDTAGIGLDTPDPPGGRIQRAADGEPTGILFENAMQLVASQIAIPSLQARMNAMRQAQELMWKAGLTGVHDVDGITCFETLQALHERGELGLRVRKAMPHHCLDEVLAIRLRAGFGDDLLRICGVKLFSDGALGPRTAAMLQPYLGEPANLGILLLEKDELRQVGERAARCELPLFVHAIGDRANRVVLDAFEELRAAEAAQGRPRLRHRIEHAQLLHPDDIPRLGRLWITASMQPVHAPSDQAMATRYWGERILQAYAWRSLLDSGAELAFGSDAPVDTFRPFVGVFAATTRRSPHAEPPSEPWMPQQCVTRREALRAYTYGAAQSVGDERAVGRLIPGFWGDLIVLDDDPLTIPAERLLQLHSVATMVAGDWKWREF
jgi:predicted amidohydrolase YtcJ